MTKLHPGLSERLFVEAAGAQLEAVPSVPSEHGAWPRLTDDQREAVNEVWDEMVVPALEEVDRANDRVIEARIEAQDARGVARHWQDLYDRLRWTLRADA